MNKLEGCKSSNLERNGSSYVERTFEETRWSLENNHANETKGGNDGNIFK